MSKNVLYVLMFVLLFVLGLGAALATFIENDFGSESAKVLVYHSNWYALVMLALSVILLAIIIKTKMWKNIGSFVFHLGFVVVLVGACITHYFGYEGVLHVREGASEDRMVSESSYLQIHTDNKTYEHPLSLSRFGNSDFSFEDLIDGKKFTVNFKAYNWTKGQSKEELLVTTNYDASSKDVSIAGGHGSMEVPSLVKYGDKTFGLSWGSKLIKLPFAIELVDFKIERYPGSLSPSSYFSDVVVLDGKKHFSQIISMNKPLSYKGYKLFQSSYDKDEKGTILSVNKDPGKLPTYVGYFLLALGFVLNFFTRHSRFVHLLNFLRSSNLGLVFTFLLFSDLAYGDYLSEFKAKTLAHSQQYASILVQDINGRIKPLSTEAIDVLHKLSSKDEMYSLKPEQILLGIFIHPLKWEKVKLVKIKNPKIKKLLNLDAQEKFISFSQIFDKKGTYKLRGFLEKANALSPSKRGTFEKDLIKLDERLNVFYLAQKGFFSKFIPKPNDPQHKWFSPQDAVSSFWLDGKIRQEIYMYHKALHQALQTGNWSKADATLAKIKNYQQRYGKDVAPSKMRVKMELFFNKAKIFQKIIGFYFIFGLLSLLFAFYSLFSSKHPKKVSFVLYGIFYMAFISHSFGLGLRWFISFHPPWSDTYESLVYIAWSAALAGILAKRSFFTLSGASVLAGIFMLVAHLSFVSPQITPLVPVLKSYWLSIHVSIITASYGFLGFGAMLGFLALVLMALRSTKNANKLDKQILQLVAINEISLIVGLCLLTVGTFLGGIWANESWGRYWGWDPKETWSFISIVVYTFILHLALIKKLNTAYIISLGSVLAFASILMTYFGVNFYLSGLHSYASGDNVLVPSFVFYVGILIGVVALFSFKARKIKGIV